MTLYRTTDHDKIRAWVEKHGGEPAVIQGVAGEEGDGILTIAFGPRNANVRTISWQEFFDTFEAEGLRLHFHDPVDNGEAGWEFGFESRDEPMDTSDETHLPDEVDDVDENMFPSAP